MCIANARLSIEGLEMNEADFRRAWQKKFDDDGRGILFRIPDSAPSVGADGSKRSAGLLPCDLVGCTSTGEAIAVEIKYQEGGRSFSSKKHFKHRKHQLVSLAEWDKLGGVALVVLGWRPIDARSAKTLEFDLKRLIGPGPVTPDTEFSINLTRESV